MLRTVAATRYVTPLREGGSMPALVEADDDGLYVVKLRGSGQGALTLVAEVLAGELARALELPVPEIVLVDVSAQLAQAEPDSEIRALVGASGGLNAGLDFLPGALPYNPAARWEPAPELAAAIVWFDALVENVDREPRNPNLLLWHGRLWMIDHGASLYRQHAGLAQADPRAAFAPISAHVLLPAASSILDADERLAAAVDRALLEGIAASVPSDWLSGEDPGVYVDYLLARLEAPRAFAEEAERARRG